MLKNDEALKMTMEITIAYLQNHTISVDEIEKLIKNIHNSFKELSIQEHEELECSTQELRPAIDPMQSVTDDYIICLEDGKKFKSLRRHLKTHYNLSPEQYRKKWNLDINYPMVAPNYANVRSSLAKQIGLGRTKGKIPA